MNDATTNLSPAVRYTGPQGEPVTEIVSTRRVAYGTMIMKLRDANDKTATCVTVAVSPIPGHPHGECDVREVECAFCGEGALGIEFIPDNQLACPSCRHNRRQNGLIPT